MRKQIGFCIFCLLPGALWAQNRSGFVRTPGVTRAVGSVVFPGGTSALPGVQRTTGSVLFPGGGGPQIGVPAPPLQGLGFTTFSKRNGIPGIGFGADRLARGNGRRNFSNAFPENQAVLYPYPVYVGGDNSGGAYEGDFGNGSASSASPLLDTLSPPSRPSIIVIYPPAAPPTGSVPPMPPAPPSGLYQPAPSLEPSATEDRATSYLIAFKDHTIYSAVAYWVEGDTLHYFTTGNTHNQASLSLVDRELTEKLNRDSGLEVKLPPAK